jgi:phosphonate transport system substrate-binding protein
VISRLLTVGVCLACIAGIAGCGPDSAQQEPAAKPTRTIVFGLVPEHNVFRQLERYEPLGEYLSEKLDANVSVRILPSYGDVLDSLESRRIDGAFLGSFVYALAHRRIGVVPIARPVAFDGSSTYHGLILARKDSGITKIETMRGKSLVLVDRATTAGYLLPLRYLREGGVEDPRGFLREVYFAGTHEDAIYDVLERRADVGAAKNTVFNRLASHDPRLAAELAVLERSPDVPENALAVRPGLDEITRDQLRRILLAMHNDPHGERFLRWFGARGFVESRDEDYEPVYRYAAEIGVDLETFDYKLDR